MSDSNLKQWQEFTQSDEFQSSLTQDQMMFDQGADTSQLLIDLSPMALIRVSGEDAETFLQGQLSNDIEQLQIGQCQIHAYCNPKGRALALLRVMRRPQGFWIMMPDDLSTKLIPRLKMFVLRAKVIIEADQSHITFCIAGGDSIEITWPEECERYAVEGTTPRQIIISPPSEGLLDQINADQWRYRNYSTWRLLDIQSAIPQIFSKTSEEFIPQMINLDLVGGISFKKGCYPGQEIVARIRYLGKLKQRMLIGSAEGINHLAPGDEVFGEGKPNQKSGLIVDAVQTGERKFCLSAMVPATLLDQGKLSIGSIEGPVIKRHPLPYDVPSDRKQESS